MIYNQAFPPIYLVQLKSEAHTKLQENETEITTNEITIWFSILKIQVMISIPLPMVAIPNAEQIW